MLGRVIKTPIDREYTPGTYTTTFDSNGLPTGVYYARFQNGPVQQVRSMLKVRQYFFYNYVAKIDIFVVQHFSQLNKLIKYNYLTAVLTLLLYVFVITPAFLWHQHKTVIVGFSVTSAESNSPCISIVGEETEESCNICSHAYSLYAGSSYSLSLVFRVFQIENKGLYSENKTICCYTELTNRGPPSLS